MPPDDPLFDQLRALPSRKLDPRASELAHRRARALVADTRQGRTLRVVRAAWSRAVAPALVTAMVASYLVWAVNATAALYH